MRSYAPTLPRYYAFGDVTRYGRARRPARRSLLAVRFNGLRAREAAPRKNTCLAARSTLPVSRRLAAEGSIARTTRRNLEIPRSDDIARRSVDTLTSIRLKPRNGKIEPRSHDAAGNMYPGIASHLPLSNYLIIIIAISSCDSMLLRGMSASQLI